MKLSSILLTFFATFSSFGYAKQIHPPPADFSTWGYFEADKLASAWLITRFINPNARIVIIPEFSTPDTGVMFDTPSAQFQRTARFSTYETLTKQFSISDPRVLRIGRYIHDIEINTWDKKLYQYTYIIQDFILSLHQNSLTDQQMLDQGMAFFDKLYRTDLQDEHEDGG